MPWGESIVGTLLDDVEGVNRDLVGAVDALGEDLFHRWRGGTAPSIAFHLWHVARWADLFQSRVSTFSSGLARLGPREQVWTSRHLVDAWKMSGALGINESGWGLDDDASATLALPSRTDVVAYAEASFAAVEEVFISLRDDELLERTGNFYDDEPWTVLDHFGWYTGHSSRHLGMIEALKGVFGIRGTVTS